MFCFAAFACANIAIEACCSTCVLARFDVSAAKSASTSLPWLGSSSWTPAED